MPTADTRAPLDVERFAQTVLGRPLWPHQSELLRSPARYRVVTAGRQSGKSTALSTQALFTASTKRDALVLIVSAGETAARRLLADAAGIAQASALFRGSVLDEGKGSLTLANGSRVVSVPASTRQIRGAATDLLIIDEAGFVDQEIWRAAEPGIIARPGSRVILSSSPWGGPDHFFRALWNRGMDHPDIEVASWHWPSSISPMVDKSLLATIRARESEEYYLREFEAQWTDETGAFFTESELTAATVDYEMTAPEDLPRFTVGNQWTPTVCGIDYGVSKDANAVALVGLLDPRQCSDRRWRFYIPHLKVQHGWTYDEFLTYIVGCCKAYDVQMAASERNGVGAWPTEDLRNRLMGTGTSVSPVWTDVRRKQSGFSKMKMLLQSGRLILPRDPELLKQLRSLEFEQTATGATKINVPDRAGHDDLAMACMQAISASNPRWLEDFPPTLGVDPRDLDRTVLTSAGVAIPRRPLPADYSGWIGSPKGDKSDGW